jgi:hypothetical protein
LEAKLINLALTAKNFEASRPFGPGWEKNSSEFFDLHYPAMMRYGGFYRGIKIMAPGTGPAVLQ